MTIAATIVQPESSGEPFSLSGTLTWGLKKKSTADEISCVTPETHLKFGWVSKEIDPIFLTGRSGIHIALLRNSTLGYT